MIADEAHAVGWRLALAGLARPSSPAAAWLVAVGVALLADNPDEAVDRLIADPPAMGADRMRTAKSRTGQICSRCTTGR